MMLLYQFLKILDTSVHVPRPFYVTSLSISIFISSELLFFSFELTRNCPNFIERIHISMMYSQINCAQQNYYFPQGYSSPASKMKDITFSVPRDSGKIPLVRSIYLLSAIKISNRFNLARYSAIKFRIKRGLSSRRRRGR